MDKQVTQKDSKAVKPQLPLELVLKIIDCFPDDPEEYSKSEEYSDADFYEPPEYLSRQSMLAKLSRICRFWHEAMTPLLFRAPRITSGYQAQNLRACLFRKDFGRMVRVLNWTISVCSSKFSNYLYASHVKHTPQLCPNLEEIVAIFTNARPSEYLEEHFFDPILENRLPLKKVYLKNFGPLHDEIIIKFPSRLPLFETLDLTGAIELDTTLMLLRGFRYLTELGLENAYTSAEMAEIEKARPPYLSIQYHLTVEE
ncbi:hypothetical protein DFS34DRAFT_317799 [Phlyctochytrium arcticum]|nr:hypothetical protein DFS34DRAFT_317799 [Phlyctochytrium arcticum]